MTGPDAPLPQEWGPPAYVQAKPRFLLPIEPREYHWFWRVPGLAWWRPLLAVVVGGVGFFLISLVVSVVGLTIDVANSGGNFKQVVEDIAAGEISRTLFVANSVAIGLMVPLAYLLQRMVGQKPGFLSSVVGRIRWGWLVTCFGISIIAVLGYVVLGIAVDGVESLGLSFQPGWPLLLVLVVLVTPFQAAGEEYLFRGVLNRSVASWIPHNGLALVVGAVVSSYAFMLVHGAGDPWLNVVYFTMGLMFSWLTWRTGGLEAAVAMHLANNIIGLGMVPFQEWGGIFDREAGAGDPVLMLQLVFLGAATVVIDVVARRRGLKTRTAPETTSGAPLRG